MSVPSTINNKRSTGGYMSGPQSNEPGQPERTPFFQRVLDNPFLLLFLGVTIPTVVYLIWGIMEIIQIPLATP
jgi:hypothetical protein